MGATIRLREMFRTTALGWHGLPALVSLTLELGPDGEARTMGEQARGCLLAKHLYFEITRDPLLSASQYVTGARDSAHRTSLR